jgi:hypothetical protein
MKLETFARIGYVARAAIYFLIGGLALLVALGDRSSGRETDSKGALRILFEQPFGKFILIVIGIGLFCYAIWRMIQSLKDHDRHGSDLKGLGIRAGLLLSGVTHAFLGFYAINLVYYFSPRASSGEGERTAAQWLMHQPFGQYLVGMVGFVILGFAASQFYRAFRETFRKYLDIPPDRDRFIAPICKFGLSARGVVFGLVGIFFVRAALNFSSEEAGGLKKTWRTLESQPFGDLLVGIVALGLIAYAVYSLTEAAYRRFAS